MARFFASIFLVGAIGALGYMVAGVAVLIGSDKATKCRAMGGEPVTDFFHLSHVRCLQQQFISIPKS